ncbi:MAG: metallophosphoesterase [Pirellulaceae bacterium]|nr:metallophosphoesterase [Pirellulaceae bacterium]
MRLFFSFRAVRTVCWISLAFVSASLCHGQIKRPAPVAAICHDGPYVWSRGDSAQTLTVVPSEAEAKIVRESLSWKSLHEHPLEVVVGDPTPARFQVQLRPTHSVPNSIWPKPARLLVTSDLEGNFDVLIRMLRSQKVIDENLKWTYGDGHLVVLGDTVDRGDYATQCLWLIYQLESEAAAAGGAVHTILGNHEAMNLAGDDRYLAPKYHWLLQETGLKIEQLFSADSEFGRWLRSKNSIEKIGDQLFVHAGISPQVLARGYSIDEINRLLRESLGFRNLQGDALFLMTSPGPFWYRGMVVAVEGEPKATAAHVQRVLEHFDVKQVVVGHTVVDSISTDFAGQVVRVDLKHPKTRKDGVARALLVEQDQVFVVGDDGTREPIRPVDR